MGCKHSNFGGICNMWDEDDTADAPAGCDDDGACLVDEDPNPEDSCDSYESEDE